MNRFPFAPGVIERQISGRIDSISRTVLVAFCLAALVAVVGFSVGYFNFSGMLP
jgi:hypothetical protein